MIINQYSPFREGHLVLTGNNCTHLNLQTSLHTHNNKWLEHMIWSVMSRYSCKWPFMLSSVSTNISTPGFGFFWCGKIRGVIKPINRGGNKRENCLFICVVSHQGKVLIRIFLSARENVHWSGNVLWLVTDKHPIKSCNPWTCRLKFLMVSEKRHSFQIHFFMYQLWSPFLHTDFDFWIPCELKIWQDRRHKPIPAHVCHDKIFFALLYNSLTL